MSNNLRVLIVGASISGPTAAYWFARAGASVTVIERFPELRTGGQNVDIRTVGVTVMRKMPGMEDAVRASKVRIEGISLVRQDGRSYGVLKPTGNPDQQSLVSEYEILRGDLSKIIFDLTKDDPNVKYVWGEQVTAMHQHDEEDGPVTVEFMNGHPSSVFDLVVACDGATSRTRSLGLGCGVREHMHPKNSWVAYCSVQQDFLNGSDIAVAYTQAGGYAVGIAADSPGKSRLAFMRVHPPSDTGAMVPLRKAAKSGPLAMKEFVARDYEAVSWRCQEALAAMMKSDDFYISEVAQVKVPTLSRGRVVLVGDSGYAAGPTGTSTSLAMLGAYVLAGEVCNGEGRSLPESLGAYEKTMRPFIADMQRIPPFVPAIFAPQTAWAVWLRNQFFAFICWSRILEFATKFSFGAFSAARDKYAVPDYNWKN